MSKELQSLIEQEIETLDQLNSLSLSKKEALFKNDLNALSEITLVEERLAQSLKKIDDACSPQVQFFLKGNINDSTVPEELKDLIRKLRKSALQLKANNQFNQELLKDSLGLVKFTVNMLTRTDKYSADTYSPTGKTVEGTVKSHLLDFKG